MRKKQAKIEVVYPFLDLLSENQALAKGVNLGDKNTYSLYHAIKKRSNMTMAKQYALFRLGMPVDGILDIAEETIKKILSQLVYEKLIAEVLQLEYRYEKLHLITCYLSLNLSDPPVCLFETVIRTSSENIGTMLKSLPVLSMQEIQKAYMDDLRGKKVTAKTHPGVLIDPFMIIQSKRFEFEPPQQHMIDASIMEIKKELLKNQEIIEVPQYGFIHIDKENMLNRYMVAEEVIRDELIGIYQNKFESLKGIFSQIFLEEAIHEMDTSSIETTEFLVKFVKAIQDISSPKKLKDSSAEKYLGKLSIETILSLMKRIETLLKERHHEKSLKDYQEYREKLFPSDKSIDMPILFVMEEEKNELTKETWNYLMNDTTVGNIQWELPDMSVFVFVRMDVESIFNIVTKMEKGKDILQWHVLSIREIFEKYGVVLNELFEIPEFLLPYGKILQRVYLKYMPWYHIILISLRIHFFIDGAYGKAKRLIRKEQYYYANRNESKRKKEEEANDKRRGAMLKSIEKLYSTNKIISHLDTSYFTRKIPPTVQDSKKFSGIDDLNEFISFIKSENFQIVSPLKKDSHLGNSLLLHPMDPSWGVRSQRIEKMANEVMSDGKSHGNEIQLRFKQILRFIQNKKKKTKLTTATKSVQAQKTKKGKDPYEIFGEELQKSENTKKREEEQKEAITV